MDFIDIARNFGQPSVAALMGPLPLAANTLFAGRSSAAYMQRGQTFNDALEKVVHRVESRFPEEVAPAENNYQESPPVTLPADYIIQQGDTLSGIVRDHLTKTGTVSRQDVVDGIALVAERNGILNPDKIISGDALDLSVLDGTGGPIEEEKDLISILADIFGDKKLEEQDHEHGEAWSVLLDGHARQSSHYGYRNDPFTGARTFHDGIDLAAKSGTPIQALRSGEVVYSGYRSGYGNTVVLKHADGVETIYAHASKLLVSKGDRIDAGSTIARVGSTGRSTGPHMHFEVRKHGKSVDPLPYLKQSTSTRLALR